jgi:multisubunit Na+/H+ antiporter MnhF subunit
MFFLRWLIGAAVALVVCAAGFALVQHLMRPTPPDGVMVATVSSIVTSIAAVFALFPRKKKKG